MDSRRHILIPIDFSEQSLLALEQSYSMARMTNSEITLLHIILENNPFWGIFNAEEKEEAVEKFHKKLQDFAEVVSKKSGIRVNTIVEKGKLIDKIIEVSERMNTRFLIVGTIVKDNFKEKIIGTNASKLVREAKCPLITIKGNKTTGDTKKIVLPLDLSKETNQKVTQAVQLARYFKSTIYVVSVATTKDSHLVARMTSQMEQVRKHINKQGLDCETDFIKVGASNASVAKQLQDYAYGIDADLMIIMTQQEDAISEHFVGSTAKEIINNSEIPVMSIAPKS
ncbi:MAG: hypothetical protein C0594_16915 [Marinilabiliales bacterium]|nr:MAG: hypothetical protein C0594_16915 [Marinilabiliales bacterium]